MKQQKLTPKQKEAQNHYGYERPDGYNDFDYADHVRECLRRDRRN